MGGRRTYTQPADAVCRGSTMATRSMAARAAVIVVTMWLFVTMWLVGGVAHAQREPCNRVAKKTAKAHFDLAEVHKQLQAFPEAAEAYLSAYRLCARPFLLFNAGQVYWLDAEDAKKRGKPGKMYRLRAKAVMLYERYVALEPNGPGGEIVRGPIFEVAEETAIAGRTEDATRLYQLYLKFAPKGQRATEARVWLDEMARERERAHHQSKAKRARAAKIRAEHSGVWDKLKRARELRPDTPKPKPPKRMGYRIGLIACIALSTFSTIVAVTNTSENVNAPPRFLFPSIALVSTSAAGYLLYKGYLQKKRSKSAALKTTIAPTLAPDWIGVRLHARF